MATMHHFQPRIAQLYGVNAAILLENLSFWIEKNRANGKNYFEGMYWTYNSVNAFVELFPYMSEKAIRTALQKLEADGVIVRGNYNASAYDRTMWYAITKKGYSILQDGDFHLPFWENGSTEKGEPIPDNKPYYKPDNNSTSSKSASALENPEEGNVKTELGQVMAYYLDHINPAPSPIATSELAQYVQELSGPVVLHALEIAVDNKRTQWSYIAAILRDYSRAGLRTLEAVLAEDAQYRENREKRGRNNDNGRGHGGAANRTPGATPGGEFDRRAFCVDLDGPGTG